MAYDPEAREASNSAMIIGVVALVLVVGGALAFFATRDDNTPNVVVAPGAPAPITRTEVVRETVPVVVPDSSPETVVVQQPAPSTNTVTRVEKTVTRDRVVQPPASSRPGAAGSGTGGTAATTEDTGASSETTTSSNTAPGY